jgi:acyl-coenzyme A thioesterase 9
MAMFRVAKRLFSIETARPAAGSLAARNTRFMLERFRANQFANYARQMNWLRSLVSTPNDGASNAPLSQPDPVLALARGKTPMDSLRELRLPFSTDESLRSFYTNAYGELRVGMLLEDLDSMAGLVGYEHSDGFARDLTIVTASLDRFELRRLFRPDADLVLQGCVTYAGHSSMEVRIDMFQAGTESEQGSSASALFTMVARDKDRAAQVPPLVCATKKERERFEQGIINKMRRKETAKLSLDVAPPSSEEQALVHWLFMSAKKARQQSDHLYVPMSKTVYENTLLMHPQFQNVHKKIFGGFLLRSAFELGFIAAQVFCGSRPTFVALDDNTFLLPVEIGALLQFKAQVVFQAKDQVVVRVVAQTIDAERGGASSITNVFHFTFHDPSCHASGAPKHVLVPETLEEANLYVEGKRKLDKGQQLKEYLSSGLQQ